MDDAGRVKQANKEFYDLAAACYEAVDGRRGKVPGWLENIIAGLAKGGTGARLLDLGAGSGWISKTAANYFSQVCAYDISAQILAQIDQGKILKVAGEAENLAFKNETFDAVVCFAALHHMYDLTPVFKEIYRVLKPGGVFYSDHDIESGFVKRFDFFLAVYRRLINPAKKYAKANPGISRQLYELTEVHSRGIDSLESVKILEKIGFSQVKTFYHWQGLTKITDWVFSARGRSFPRCSAPIVSFLAVK